MLAYQAPGWNALSDKRVRESVDWMVLDVDPDALRVARRDDDDRHIDVLPGRNGMAEICGVVRAADAAAFTQRLDALVATVCADDPRTKRQRRADALTAAMAGAAAMDCQCGSDRCPVAGNATAPSAVVVHVVAEAATISGASDKPGFQAGFGVLPPAMLGELAKTAELKPIIVPKGAVTEPQYRPSAGLAQFVRCRDLTCRWMGCDRPAWAGDVDHTVPYPFGPTHASNTGCYCRFHHLLKTFYCGPDGWNETQLPDGSIVFTSPNGRTHVTTPFGAQLFPALATPTGELRDVNHPSPGVYRGLAMPRRKRTRAAERAYRIQRERNINAARNADAPF